jgi:rhamnose utilization protein RhaD (predicted bifunctional aldolase and dehydrogenase)
MVGYLPHATFNLNPRAASIDTPLHAFVPRPCRPHAPGRHHRHRGQQADSRR